jgi:hypothetical protein
MTATRSSEMTIVANVSFQRAVWIFIINMLRRLAASSQCGGNSPSERCVLVVQAQGRELIRQAPNTLVDERHCRRDAICIPYLRHPIDFSLRTSQSLN